MQVHETRWGREVHWNYVLSRNDGQDVTDEQLDRIFFAFVDALHREEMHSQGGSYWGAREPKVGRPAPRFGPEVRWSFTLARDSGDQITDEQLERIWAAFIEAVAREGMSAGGGYSPCTEEESP